MSGALEGIRVVEVASYVTGPYAAMLLGDLGADVVKVEEPGTGDPFRGWENERYSPTFLGLNRNKRSVELDLRSDDGRDALRDLLRTADVLVENHRPGVMDRMGFGYDAVRALNRRLVYCAISGFGSHGPDRDLPGYDTVGQARSGLLGLLTDLDDPQPMGVSLADHVTGLTAAYGVLGALVARGRTGAGQLVETSLLQACLAFLAEGTGRYLATGNTPTRGSRAKLAQIFAFRASDGLPFVVHLSSPQKFWEGLVAAIERPALLDDTRFRTRADRIAHHDELTALLRETFVTVPRESWLERLRAHDVPCAPIRTLDEVFADPHVQALGLRVRAMHPERGAVDLVGPGVTLSATPASVRAAPPVLGEHTAEVTEDLRSSKR